MSSHHDRQLRRVLKEEVRQPKSWTRLQLQTAPEKRFAEFRVDDDGISGTIIRYGDRSSFGDWSEEFLPDSISFDDMIVNLQHDRSRPVARTGGAGLTITNGPESLDASISFPETVYGREARELVSAGILRGFSMEFRASGERWKGRHRVVLAARMTGFAIVDKPAYTDSQIAKRMAERKGLDENSNFTRIFWY